jgi:hypothetical protein
MGQPLEFVIRDARDKLTVTLREFAAHRLSFALRRFEHRVRHVTVRLVDLNGPKRGIDSRCSITLDFVDGRRIFVDATTAWPFAPRRRRLNAVLRSDTHQT